MAPTLRGLSMVLSCVAFAAGCADQSEPTTRPYPVGDPPAQSRALTSEVPAFDVRTATMTPGHVFIPAIGVNTTVMRLGTHTAADPFVDGARVSTFDVPPDLSRVGWWADGAAPGRSGMAVLLGHSQAGGGYAVFNRLADLVPGDGILLDDARGRGRLQYKVTEVVTGIAKTDPAALRRQLSVHSATDQLALITCSGDFDSSVRESEDNTVAFAELAGGAR
ncbi:class F sortase [Williamsia deligens]|uniref:Class F sortase n=1 Tax=Williamsia deligens TaxID=321325 RepID=A0ABW3G296_9NOCA|nr:class F sortase [Williamsia deligens]